LIERGFLSLKRRVWARCVVELKEPLHVGAGRDPVSPIDLPVIRNASGVPVIPGSTLKGFFRSYLARLLTGYSLTGGKELRIGDTTIRLEPCIDSVNEKIKLEDWNKLCLLDRIFGSSGNISLASTIKFTDAMLTSDLREESTLKRTHVKIDSKRDVAERRMLVNVEAVKELVGGESTKFVFTIVFDELSEDFFRESNKLFYLLLLMLHKGIDAFLGGWRSRGYGHVIIKLESIRYATVKDLIEGRDPVEVPCDQLKDWILGSLREGCENER